MEYPIALNKFVRFFALFAMPVALGACSNTPKPEKMTVDILQSQLDTALPTGTDMVKVERYLAENSFEKSDLIDNAEGAHMGADPETLELRTIVRNTKKSLLVTTDITMVFTFDRSKKLKNIAVKEVHTGL